MNYEVAPFPLNNPLTPTTLEVHAIAFCAACVLSSCKCQANFKIRAGISRFQIQWQVITRLEFGKLLRRVSKVLKFALRNKTM